jgi:hypothetical protein
LSEALTLLLDSTESPDAAVRGIIGSPGLLAEVRSALPALKAVAEAKAGTDGVKAVIGRRLALYPQPQRTDAEAAAWWADYYDTLADVTLASLEAGMRAYVALPSSEFMPKPGQLRELAFTAPCRTLSRYYRAKRTLQIADAPPEIEAPRADPVAVKALLAEFETRTVAKSKPELPSIAGKVDEGGLTQAMRDLMARRQAEGRA